MHTGESINGWGVRGRFLLVCGTKNGPFNCEVDFQLPLALNH